MRKGERKMTGLELYAHNNNVTPDELVINALREKCSYALFSAVDARAASNCAKWESIGTEAENYIFKVIDDAAIEGSNAAVIWLIDVYHEIDRSKRIKMLNNIRSYLRALGYDVDVMESVKPDGTKFLDTNFDFRITITW